MAIETDTASATGAAAHHSCLLRFSVNEENLMVKLIRRPHMAVDLGVPDPPKTTHHNFNSRIRHRLHEGVAVRANSVLDRLYREYFLATAVVPPSICG